MSLALVVLALSLVALWSVEDNSSQGLNVLPGESSTPADGELNTARTVFEVTGSDLVVGLNRERDKLDSDRTTLGASTVLEFPDKLDTLPELQSAKRIVAEERVLLDEYDRRCERVAAEALERLKRDISSAARRDEMAGRMQAFSQKLLALGHGLTAGAREVCDNTDGIIQFLISRVEHFTVEKNNFIFDNQADAREMQRLADHRRQVLARQRQRAAEALNKGREPKGHLD
ncbi:MAG TPA: hypothetical protein VF669_11115 [Tepidisphaeraceae bacterium]|jgi:hypothetical protein